MSYAFHFFLCLKRNETKKKPLPKNMPPLRFGLFGSKVLASRVVFDAAQCLAVDFQSLAINFCFLGMDFECLGVDLQRLEVNCEPLETKF
ncbi:MAG: hypothetical protein LBU91_00540 [Bacteroidales bacterium]|jgi:hypothetical protein|nr:hypothetical protein [Bacteroidales bacterium]